MLKTALQIHKWVGLVVAIQVLFWVTGGLVMSALPIERVRGENHAPAKAPSTPIMITAVKPLADLQLQQDSVVGARLRSSPRGPLWVVDLNAQRQVFDALTGRRLSALTPAGARLAAAQAYVGDGKPSLGVLLETPPQEAATESAVYAVTFDDAVRTTLYLDPDTGEVIRRRSNLWRFYDVFWRLHIMDWPSGENFNHPLIVAAAALTLFVTVTGIILLWLRLARDLRNTRHHRRRQRASASL